MARTVSGTNSIRAQATAQDQSRAVLFEQLRQGCAELGGLLAKASIGGASIAAGIPSLSSRVSVGQGLLVEGVLTFFLVSAVFGTVIDDRFGGRMGGLAIGLSVALGVLAGGPLTGAAMNPARWFGPALAQGTYPNPLVFILGPLVGGVLAGLLWHYVLLPRRR